MNKINTIKNYKILTIPMEESNIIYVQSFILSGRMNESSYDSAY